jgi:hypothetical protein
MADTTKDSQGETAEETMPLDEMRWRVEQLLVSHPDAAFVPMERSLAQAVFEHVRSVAEPADSKPSGKDAAQPSPPASSGS